MPITYDLETDIRYLQGIEKNKIDIIKKGLQEGIFDIKGLSILTGVPIEEIERIKKDMELDINSSE